MTISQAISAHIPYLRRFSRALTGTQTGGDAYVLATLEAVVADPAEFAENADLKIALYRLFLKVWGSMPVNEHVDQMSFSADERGAQHNLEAIPLRPRVAFLLSSLEGFDKTEVARAMDLSLDEAAHLIDLAGKEISNQIRTDVLIIEDEPLIAIDIQMLVEELGHRVIHVARTHKEAIEAVRTTKPGLILADIQLADGSSGLEAVNQILGSLSVPVIFITAYPERFLTGTPPEPAFLITKPFGVDSLKAIISQALFFDRKSHRKDAQESSSALV
ncbi:response regulator [Methylovirgula sp. HY1]|uniref:response regulator n=1 Tax=Methylovirgula sp. HY1 TaxID=2822761 RepID=UPI001C5B35E3|nr:response regulator [Methylovirgula sp. HY1]QXX75328.1 putative transcriptional regulatory protein pdtaR [Methylovirgula sp. HY1]